MSSDAQLLDAWRKGDAGAGRELFLRHIDCVSRFFRNKVGDEREDLIQRTFLACVESRDKIRDGEKFRPYLLTVARSKLYDHYAKKAHPGQQIDPLTTTLMNLDSSPSRIVARRQQERALVDGLRRLPLDLQIAVELHYWEGLSMEELGRVLDVPTGTAKTRLFRARTLLREQLERVGAGSGVSDDDLAEWAAALRRIVDDEQLLDR